nr:hypothetical protein [Angustibacter aerolatus]
MPATPVTIRDATGAELEAAGDVVAGAYDHESLASDRYLARLRDARGRAASAAVLVALDGAEVVGTVTYALSGTPSAEPVGPLAGRRRACVRWASRRPPGAVGWRRRWCGPASTGPGARGAAASCSRPRRRCTRRSGCTGGSGSCAVPTSTGCPSPASTCSATSLVL